MRHACKNDKVNGNLMLNNILPVPGVNFVITEN